MSKRTVRVRQQRATEDRERSVAQDVEHPARLEPRGLPQLLGNQAFGELLRVPSLVRAVLHDSGSALPGGLATEYGQRLGADFSGVRLHTDRRADRSARQLGALAYTWGEHVVLSKRAQQDPGTILPHELAHVRQQAGRAAGEPSRVLPAGSIAETRPYLGDPGPGAESGLALMRDPALDALLAKVPEMAKQAGAGDPAASLRALAVHFQAVDLTDDDNLVPVAAVIRAHYPPRVVELFLRAAESVRARKAEVTAGQAAPDGEMARKVELLRVQRGGVRGWRTPATPLTATAQLLEPVAEPLAYGAESVRAFLRGVERGFGHADPALYERLQRKLTDTMAARIVVPQVFAAGAVVGIAGDLLDALRAIVDLPDVIAQIRELAALLFSPEGAAVAEELGVGVGQNYRGELVGLLDKDTTAFNYELGKLVGPTIVYVILSFLGVSLAGLAAEAGVRLAATLRRSAAVAKALERLRKYAKPIAKGAAELYRDQRGALRISTGPAIAGELPGPPRLRVATEPPGAGPRIAVAEAESLEEAPAAAAKRAQIAQKGAAPYTQPGFGKKPELPVAPERPEVQRIPERGKPAGTGAPGPERPPLPVGEAARRLEVAPGRFSVSSQRLRPSLQAAEREILEQIERNPREATRLGNRYRDLVDQDLQTVADPKRTPESFGWEGRRPDIGTSHEVTLEGMREGFGSGKLDQLWRDLVRTGQVQLTVPRLSEAAMDQLRRLGAQAEAELGKTVRIYVRQTAP